MPQKLGTGLQQLLHTTLSRRALLQGAVSTVTIAGMKSIGRAQGQRMQPMLTDGPPPCEGTCVISPFIIIPNGPNDTGMRSNDPNDHSLGPPSPSVWFESAQTGQRVSALTPGQDYVIVANVKNAGSGPTFCLRVDFLVWTATTPTEDIYSMTSVKQGLVLMEGEPQEIRSDPWTPGFGRGLKPGDVIVRAYDPWSDRYTDTGWYLFVNRDRHLAHCPYA
jgi:hypothetical protein